MTKQLKFPITELWCQFQTQPWLQRDREKRVPWLEEGSDSLPQGKGQESSRVGSAHSHRAKLTSSRCPEHRAKGTLLGNKTFF